MNDSYSDCDPGSSPEDRKDYGPNTGCDPGSSNKGRNDPRPSPNCDPGCSSEDRNDSGSNPNCDPKPIPGVRSNPGTSQADQISDSDSEELPTVPFLKTSVTSLYELFPNLSKDAIDMIYKLASQNYTVAVNCLLDLSPKRILDLIGKFTMTGPSLKLRIEEDCIFEEALAYYKKQSFDSTRPLRLSLANQPAIDTGGVRQQFFHDIFEQFAFKDPYAMFEGEKYQLRPHFSPGLLPLFKLLGTMIAHSLIQNGPGFPYFAPYVYWYLVTRSEEMALTYVTTEDLSLPIKEIINQVSKTIL